ncbi:MAG: FAD-dependent oxidoreductase [Luteolibacter sp.]
MDLTSNHPYWTLRNGLLSIHPPLESDEHCDMIVLGAGISGSLVAEALTADGHDVVMLDAREIGHGSTSASTALLQYEIDTHLIDLISLHGERSARLAYQACYESIDLLDQLIRSTPGDDCGFVRKDSVYLASRQRDASILAAECEARKAAGIEVELWNEADVRSHFDFARPAALHSPQAAEVDPYRLTNRLLHTIVSRGGRIYDRTCAVRVDTNRDGLIVRTNRRTNVYGKRLIVATGYETESLFDTGDLVDLRSSFALASEPLAQGSRWWRDCLLWETARPYFYLRTDADGRALLGGEDIPFRNPALRDKLIGRKTARLEKRWQELFPQAPMEPAYRWAGTFGETRDGLAYIGRHRGHPLCHFALGFGGNGITYSAIAAEILRRQVRGLPHPWEPVFRFDRD